MTKTKNLIFLSIILLFTSSCEKAIEPKVKDMVKNENVDNESPSKKDSTNVDLDNTGYNRKGSIYVLSEGNLSSENGSIAYISPKGDITNNLCVDSFTGASNIMQDMYIHSGTTYIISQNKGLYTYNSKTLSAIKNYHLDGIKYPTNIAVFDNEHIFIRANNGVFRININENPIVPRKFMNNTNGKKQGLVIKDNKVYIPVDTMVSIIGKDDMYATRAVKFHGRVNGLSFDKNGYMYVATKDDEASYIYIVNTNDKLFPKTKITVPMGIDYSHLSSIVSKGDSIYFIKSIDRKPNLYRYIVSSNKFQELANIYNDNPNAALYYGAIGVSPTDNMLYVALIKGYAEYKKNSILKYDILSDKADLMKAYDNKTFFPCGIYFRDNY